VPSLGIFIVDSSVLGSNCRAKRNSQQNYQNSSPCHLEQPFVFSSSTRIFTLEENSKIGHHVVENWNLVIEAAFVGNKVYKTCASLRNI
jgi:hypothetical protein